MVRLVDRMERHQVALYLGAIVFGVVVGMLVPAVAGPLELCHQLCNGENRIAIPCKHWDRGSGG